eukprot:TRINITY_DN4073_c0_g1_i1.p1 TRINITY_DN4073_c0_g1~~TRINITY_DN4073_c0_g1_i1.p1  ORF type:complete len:242 (+),score=50.13 TRINITY_DN4073_c0_g1_i1:484-1209(+)
MVRSKSGVNTVKRTVVLCDQQCTAFYVSFWGNDMHVATSLKEKTVVAFANLHVTTFDNGTSGSYAFETQIFPEPSLLQARSLVQWIASYPAALADADSLLADEAVQQYSVAAVRRLLAAQLPAQLGCVVGVMCLPSLRLLQSTAEDAAANTDTVAEPHCVLQFTFADCTGSIEHVTLWGGAAEACVGVPVAQLAALPEDAVYALLRRGCCWRRHRLTFRAAPGGRLTALRCARVDVDDLAV